MRYLIIIEETTTGYSAYLPDLSGCISNGETREKLDKICMKQQSFTQKDLSLESYEIPQLSASSAYVKVIVSQDLLCYG